jgi:hypothetical protein
LAFEATVAALRQPYLPHAAAPQQRMDGVSADLHADQGICGDYDRCAF